MKQLDDKNLLQDNSYVQVIVYYLYFLKSNISEIAYTEEIYGNGVHIFLFYFYSHLCFCFNLHMCVGVPTEAQRSFQFQRTLELKLLTAVNPQTWVLETNHSPLKQQQLTLTAEPYLQLPDDVSHQWVAIHALNVGSLKIVLSSSYYEVLSSHFSVNQCLIVGSKACILNCSQ